MAYDVTDFRTLMQLEPEGPDVYVGVGPRYPWGRVYGGQVIAQALRAAYETVQSDFQVHSVHAYFIRGGDAEEPIRYEVDRIRDGRSFLTRRVVARQSMGPILNLSASFQVQEDQADAQVCLMAEGVPDPESLPPSDWGEILQRRMVPFADSPARAACWLKVTPPVGEDPVLQACALAYASDDMPMEAVGLSHPMRPEPTADQGSFDRLFVNASLDHSIWFHRPGRSDDWVLHDLRGMGVAGARGLGMGELYSRDGTHLATVAQEVLLREKTR